MMLITLNRLFRRKYFIFLVLIICTFSVIGEMYHYLILSKSSMMKISLNYPGAEQGLNPDGSRFNISEMANRDMIDAAKENLNMRYMSYDDVKKRVFITTKFSQNAMDEVVSEVRDGIEGSYVPTTFYVYYSQKNKLQKNETYEFLNALAENYIESFNKKHAENNSVLYYKPEDFNFSSYDYSEIYSVLHDKTEGMLALARTHKEENRGFRAENNLNFGTVIDELVNFKDVKLEKFYAYVIQNNISKNRPDFMGKLIYLIDKNTITFDKLMQASAISKGALDKYDSNITAVAFVPSVDSDRSYYMSRTKTGIDDLAKKSYEDGMDASRISKKLDEYNQRYGKLSVADNTSSESLEIAQDYLEELLSDLKSLSEKTVDLDNEYLNYKTEKYISYKVNDKSRPVDLKVIFKFAVLGFIMAVLIILYMEFLHGAINRRTRRAKSVIATMTKHSKEMRK